MKKILILLVSIALGINLRAQIPIIKNNKPVSRIILTNPDSGSIKAAKLLNHFIKRISGTNLPILYNNGNSQYDKKGDIIIAAENFRKTGPSLGPDDFRLFSNNANFTITGGHGEGCTYGVIEILEDYWGVGYYATESYTVPRKSNLVLPSNLQRTEKPTFRYRQTQAYSLASDPMYKLWFRLNDPGEIFAANYWVHTFDRILPSKKYGLTHPEYYSYIRGERRPGAASQWCLSNPEVFEVVSQQIDSIFKANPDKKMISVSQNDGNNTQCTCENCKAIDAAEGSPSGSLIRFLNKLAIRFPDKEFSTLAYLYSMTPPKITRPLPNVNIMLCDIDCYREVSLTENASGREFVKAMEGWSAISNNIFVWDYGINFDNFISPFPNFHILQTNMRLFKKNNVQMHFSQIGGTKGGDFSELRSYVVAKLMWNVHYNVDSLIQHFLNGYYGPAAPFLYQYIKLQAGALLGSGTPLWIYDTPVTHKNGMLNAALLRRYRKLFDDAEKAVVDQQVFLNRVQQQRLTIQYAELEIARTAPFEDVDAIKRELSTFRERARHLGVTMLNERNNTVEEYCELYLKRNLPGSKQSLAALAPVIYTQAPSKPYDKIAPKALTDGLLGGATFNESWVGWEGRDAEFVIDLGKIQEVQIVEADFLHKLGAWILLPKSFSCSTSTDSLHFIPMGQTGIEEDRSPEVKYVPVTVRSKEKIRARYIKINIQTIGLCPSWHYGVGYPAWFFLDEVWVY